MRLIFAFFTFISLVSFNHVSAEDGWLYPGRPDDNFLDPKLNPNWTIGSTQHLQWYVSLSMYYLALVQKDNKAKPVTMLIVFDGEEYTGLISYDWTISIPASILANGSTFYLGIADPNTTDDVSSIQLRSHDFNIVKKATDEISNSTSGQSTSNTQSITSSASTGVSTSIKPAPSTSSVISFPTFPIPTDLDTVDKKDPNITRVGVGVGIGLGLCLIVCIGIIIKLCITRSQNKKKAPATTVDPRPPVPPKSPTYQSPNSFLSELGWTTEAQNRIYEAPQAPDPVELQGRRIEGTRNSTQPPVELYGSDFRRSPPPTVA